MSRRTERVASLIRNTLGPILLAKMSDPRFDPLKVSITRVEPPEDLLTAKVYLSVAGEKPEEEKRTLAALRHAAGYLQEQLMKQVQLRNTPKLLFEIDEQHKKTMRTLNLISEVSAELREKDLARARAEGLDTGQEDGRTQTLLDRPGSTRVHDAGCESE